MSGISVEEVPPHAENIWNGMWTVTTFVTHKWGFCW